ncbi:MAG: transketolase [Candidatus Neomarinimicrobiota bacterium]|jgi:transketolase
MDSRELAKRIRIHTLKMISSGGSSHIGAAFSIVEILAVLYNDILKIYPDNPKSDRRDRFILSKGHAGAAVYATLAEKGFFNIEKLKTHYQDGSDLCGHVSHKGILGVDLSTGSLGHGLSVGAGMALAGRIDNKKHRVFVLLSDGECDEGSTWEAVLFAAHHKLDNLIAIVDYNKIQSLAPVAETITLEPFSEKWKSFNWAVQEVDGHNNNLLYDTLNNIPFYKDKPSVLIAHTIKGKGVSFMENQVLWHYRCPRGEEFEAALKELEAR